MNLEQIARICHETNKAWCGFSLLIIVAVILSGCEPPTPGKYLITYQNGDTEVLTSYRVNHYEQYKIFQGGAHFYEVNGEVIHRYGIRKIELICSTKNCGSTEYSTE